MRLLLRVLRLLCLWVIVCFKVVLVASYSGYQTVEGRDQDGQTIQYYSWFVDTCKSDCDDDDDKCAGIVIGFAADCWTIKGFPSTYSSKSATTYKKIRKYTGYTTLVGQDQDGTTISKFDNDQQAKCKAACDANSACAGIIVDAITSTCWTVSSFPGPYSRKSSISYIKATLPPTLNPTLIPSSCISHLCRRILLVFGIKFVLENVSCWINFGRRLLHLLPRNRQIFK